MQRPTTALGFLFVLFASGLSTAQPSGSPRMQAIRDVTRLIQETDAASLEQFATDRIAPPLAIEYGDSLATHLREVRATLSPLRLWSTTALGPYFVEMGYRGSDVAFRLRLELETTPPHRFLSISVVESKKDACLSPADRAQVVEDVSELLIGGYIYEDVARRMAESIRARFGDGVYDSAGNAAELSERLTADLQAISSDRHLRIFPDAAWGSKRRVDRGDPACPPICSGSEPTWWIRSGVGGPNRGRDGRTRRFRGSVLSMSPCIC